MARSATAAPTPPLIAGRAGQRSSSTVARSPRVRSSGWHPPSGQIRTDPSVSAAPRPTDISLHSQESGRSVVTLPVELLGAGVLSPGVVALLGRLVLVAQGQSCPSACQRTRAPGHHLPCLRSRSPECRLRPARRSPIASRRLRRQAPSRPRGPGGRFRLLRIGGPGGPRGHSGTRPIWATVSHSMPVGVGPTQPPCPKLVSSRVVAMRPSKLTWADGEIGHLRHGRGIGIRQGPPRPPGGVSSTSAHASPSRPRRSSCTPPTGFCEE